MAVKIAQMTKNEFKVMVSMIIEEKMLELIGDPDQGLKFKKSLRTRLLRQKRAVAKGERGKPFEAVARKLKAA